ncbi:MAG TPA: GNAT family N-acetyltransferase [Acidimicrobiia bacterium]|nr:GNAT family N-acetyltransferase [Acidimicrobiia bacterium]
MSGDLERRLTVSGHLEIRPLRDEERDAAGAVAGRALRDNPMMTYSVPDDRLGRLQVSYDTFGDRILAGSVGALIGPYVIGVAASLPSAACVAVSTPTDLRVQPEVAPDAAVGIDRARHTIWTMCEHDPEERHVHVGPVGVEPGAQGLGVGAAMLRMLCEQLDEDGELAWLETDKPENVVFYRRSGFDVAVEDDHLGFPIWFMSRHPR